MSEEKVETPPVEGPRGNTIGMRRSYARTDAPSKFVKKYHRRARAASKDTPSLRAFVIRDKGLLGPKAAQWLTNKGIK